MSLFQFWFRFISLGIYPSLLKIARVAPIYKSGEHDLASNYRPISNLCTFNKIFEILIFKRFSNFIEKNCILSPKQFGFRKESSKTLAIFTLLTDFSRTFYKKMYTIVLFLDLKKAFDVVDRSILLDKLSSYGFRGRANDLMKSYLNERKQYVSIDYVDSTVKPIIYGVPQGSILGPLLFLLFINDMDRIPGADMVLFADDAALYVSDDSFDNCISKIKKVISHLSAWLSVNRLVPNLLKTKLMLVTPRHVPCLPHVLFNNVKLEWVDNIKYLGLVIDSKLKFDHQFDVVKRKLNQYRGIFYSLKGVFPRFLLLKLYYSLVYPTLIQDVVIWGGMCKTNLVEIHILINKILRNILNVQYINYVPVIPVNDMYKTLKLLKFEDIYTFFLLKFIHFLLYKRFDLFEEHFSSYLPNNDYAIRNQRINLPLVRTEVEKRFTIFKICYLIRNIPQEFLMPCSLHILKRKFKDFTLSQY